MIPSIRKGIFALTGLHVLLWLALGSPWPGTDDLCYLNQAERIADGTYQFDESPKNQRLGMILPTYVAISLFGKSPATIAIYPLLASILSIVLLIYFLRSQPTIALLGGLLLACNITQLTFATVLFPDVILALVMFATTYLIWNREKGGVLNAIAAALLLIIGFFIKQLILLLIPYLAFLIIRDIARGEHLQFAKVFIGASVALWTTMLVSVFSYTGDWLFLLKTVEENHNAVFASLEGVALWKRLTYEPLVFLSGLAGYWPLLILSAAGLMSKTQYPEERKLRELTAYLLVVFWFTSTSLESYAPVLLLDRMWIALLIPLCGLAAIAMGKINDYGWKRRTIVFVLFFLSATICLIKEHEGEAVFYLLIPTTIIIINALSRWHYNKMSKDYIGLLSAIPFLLIAIWFVWSNSLRLG